MALPRSKCVSAWRGGLGVYCGKKLFSAFKGAQRKPFILLLVLLNVVCYKCQRNTEQGVVS